MTWYNSRYNELITNSHRINFKVPLHFISSIFQALQAMCFKHWISSQVSCKLLECKVFCCGLPSAPVAEMPVFWEDLTLVGSSINLCMKPPLVTIVSNRNRNFVTLKGLSYVVKKRVPFLPQARDYDSCWVSNAPFHEGFCIQWESPRCCSVYMELDRGKIAYCSSGLNWLAFWFSFTVYLFGLVKKMRCRNFMGPNEAVCFP